MYSKLLLGPLEHIAQERDVTDITVTCDGQVWVDRGSGMQLAMMHSSVNSPQGVREYAAQLCAQLGTRLDDAHPIADASTYDGIRIHAVIAPLVPYGASLSIRLPDKTVATLDELLALHTFPAIWLPVLQAVVDSHATVLVAGGTGTGKTTLLKALLNRVDPQERIVSVEEVRELGAINHDNAVSLVSREANVEGQGAVTLSQLVKATLRMRPDRVVLGECRGKEIADLLRALNSGHRGGMATVHADSIERLPARLITLGLLADLTPQAVALLASGAFDVVIHMRRGERGNRYIAQIGHLSIDDHGRLVGIMACSWDGRRSPQYGSSWQSCATMLGLDPNAPYFQHIQHVQQLQEQHIQHTSPQSTQYAIQTDVCDYRVPVLTTEHSSRQEAVHDE